MNKNDNMYGESREQENEMQNNPRTNANTNDLDSRSNSGDNSGRSSGGNAEGVLDSLDELGSLEKGHFLKSIDDLIGGKLSHF